MRGLTYCDGHFVASGPGVGYPYGLGVVDPPRKQDRPATAISVTKAQLDLWMWRSRYVWVKKTRASMSVYASTSNEDFTASGHLVRSLNEVSYTPSFGSLAPESYLAGYGRSRTPYARTLGENTSMSSNSGNNASGVDFLHYDDGSIDDDVIDTTTEPGHTWSYFVQKAWSAGWMLGDGVAGKDDAGYWFDPIPVFGNGFHIVGQFEYQGASAFASGFSINGSWSLTPFPPSGTSFYSGPITDPGGPEEADPAHGYGRTINKGQIGVIKASTATGPFQNFPDIPVYGQIGAGSFIMGSLGSDMGYYPSISDGHILTFEAELEVDYKPYGGIYEEDTGNRF